MSDDIPTVDEIILSLENHPELLRELRQRLIWTCRRCGGEKKLDGKQCPACDGTGSLPLMHLTERQISLGAPPVGGFGYQAVRMDFSLLITAPQGADQVVAFLTSLTGGHPWE